MKIEVKVISNAKKNNLEKTTIGYKARLAAPPDEPSNATAFASDGERSEGKSRSRGEVGGKANEALIQLLSKEFGVPKRDIEIAKGATSRNKTAEVSK